VPHRAGIADRASGGTCPGPVGRAHSKPFDDADECSVAFVNSMTFARHSLTSATIFFPDCNIASTAFGCAHNICGFFAAALRTGLLPCNQVRPERTGAKLSAEVTSRLCPRMETQCVWMSTVP